MEQVKRRLVVEVLAMHRAHQRDVVGYLGQAGQQLGKLHSAAAVSRELVGRREEAADLVREFDLVEDIARRFGAGVLRQHRFRIKQVDLARPAILEQMDDRFGFGVEMRGLRFQVVGFATAG